MKRSAFITALASEARTLRPAVRGGAGSSVTHGMLIVVGGVGAVAASRAAASAIEAGATALVSWGYAGALAPDVTGGTLVIADRVLCADGTGFDTDTRWREALSACICGQQALRCAALLSVSAVLADEESKSQHFRSTGAVAVDMESAAIAQVASSCRVPFIAVRAVIDTARDELPRSLADAVDSKGALRWWALCKDVARSPVAIGQLLHLSGSYRAARRALTAAALVGEQHLHPIEPEVVM